LNPVYQDRNIRSWPPTILFEIETMFSARNEHSELAIRDDNS
jgi:hypothetical protein